VDVPGFQDARRGDLLMAYSIKTHEVDRLLNVLVPLGWELKEEVYEETGIRLVIHKELSAELLAVSAELEKIIPPK